MNTKLTWILVMAAAAMFAFIVLVERPIRQEHARDINHTILQDLNPAAVTRIVIHPADKLEIRAEKGPQGWQLTSPISYPAASQRIEAMLAGLSKLEWQTRITADELKDRPDASEEFGFAKAQFSILLEGANGKRHFSVGAISAMGDQVFLQGGDSTTIYLAGADVLKLIPSEPNAWRDLAVMNLAATPFQTLRVRSGGKGFELERDATNHLWRMNAPLQARADTPRIEALLEWLRTLQVNRFVSDDTQADLEPYGLQSSPQTPDLELSFLNGTNVTLALQVGSSPTNDANLAYARRSNPGNVIEIPRAPLRPWQSAYTNFLDRHLLSVSPGLIDSIETQGEDHFIARLQTDGGWQIAGTETFAADPVLMREWLASFTNIEARIEQTVVADFAGYGLDKPLTQYTLKSSIAGGDNSNQVLAVILFGTNKAGTVFERRTDESSVNVIGNDEFARLPRVSWQLRDRRIWNFDGSNVVSITVQQLGGHRKMIRDPNNEWTFAPGSVGKINPFSLEEALRRLGDLKAVYWSGRGDEHLERFGFGQTDFQVSFEVKTGEGIVTNAIQFGKASPYLHPYASVIKNGQRLIFEFPADLYANFIQRDLAIPAALRRY